MSDLVLKSEQQILADEITNLQSKTGMNDFDPGSNILTLLEINAQELFQQYVQLSNIVRNYNLDTTTGSDLDTRAFEYKLTRNLALKASGLISILRDPSFVKVSSALYSGLPAPINNDTKVRVNNASSLLYGTSGTLILGRGTSNEEEITYSTAPVNFINYWEFTTSPCSNDHGLDESVILKQGIDESILSGTVILVPASGSSPDIKFTVDHDTILLSGEAEVDNVSVTCSVAGSLGNIPVLAINGASAFSSAPFSGAQAQNDAKFTTGEDVEIDEDFRNRIKNKIQSLSKATKIALKSAIVGLVDTATAKRVVSANIILPTQATDPVIIYIDDGTGFEPEFLSEGLEVIVDQATGGETRLQLGLIPLVKAQVESNLIQPYNMSAFGLTLSYQIGTQTEVITFSPSDFAFSASATADEVVAAINKRANLIEARTSEVASKIVISAKADINEDIQVTGGSANSIIQFPTDARSTLYLYVDDKLLSKDGATAFIDAGIQETYDFQGIGGSSWPLNIVVDGKTANPQVVTFNTADFSDPSRALASEVVAVINAQLAGAEASIINTSSVRITSNRDLDADSKIHITGGSANSVLLFSTNQIVGSDRDYTLNRDLGTIELVKPLVANQTVTAGSQFTRARLTTASPEMFSITAGDTLVVSVDGAGNQTVTFPATGLFAASQVAAYINAQLMGATAAVRVLEGSNFLSVTTNTYNQSIGSIRIQSSSTAALSFPLNTTLTNQRPHRAYAITQNTAPYTFVLGHNLVVVIDNVPATKTFTIVFDYAGSVTSGASPSSFAVSAFNVVFPNDGDLMAFYAIAKSGANTTSGSIASAINVSGNTWRYSFSALPANLADMAAGDHISISNLVNAGNNGNFLLTAVDPSGNGTVDVTNPNGAAEILSSGTGLIGQRRQISGHTGASGAITVSSPFRVTFAPSDSMSVLPSTLKNVIAFFNNKKVTTLSTKAFIDAAEVDSKVQISSQAQGSDGYVQITGGSANTVLNFSTSIFRGLQGYNYYRGLLWEVFKTIYGDDTDNITYPGVGAAGIQFHILAPTKQDVFFNITLTLSEGVSISNVEDDVRSAITGYVDSLDIGEDVIRATVIQKIMEVNNIVDVVLIAPTGNIAIADNELARTKNSLITIG